MAEALIALLALASGASTPSPARATASLGSYVTPDDYPREAILAGEQGTTAFRLSVSTEGRVVGCSITESSGSARLDAATCRALSERASFVAARDPSGRAVPDQVSGRVRWVLPAVLAELPWDMQRAVHNVWEVTAEGGQRSCRRELHFEDGSRFDIPICLPLDTSFVAAAAQYLQARPAEIMTVRLENRWLLDPVLPFAAVPEHLGMILARGEARYRLNDDLSVQSCVDGRLTSQFRWRVQPCFRDSFMGQVPAGTRDVRMEVQWVVSRGPDTQQPASLPSFTSAGRTSEQPILPGTPPPP